MANKEVKVGDDWYLGENNDGDLIFYNTRQNEVVKAIDVITGAEDKKGNSVNNQFSYTLSTRLPPHRIEQSVDYEHEPHVIHLEDQKFVIIYRTASEHTANDGKVVQRISTDGGESWGSETTIVDDPSYSVSNPTLYYDQDSNRLILFYRIVDVGGAGLQDIYFITSTDQGSNWSSATTITSELNNAVCQFGRAILTDAGLMQLFYESNYIEALFSTDNGQSWGSREDILDTSGDTAIATEPVAIALDQSHVLILFRDNEDGYFGALTGVYDGSSWTWNSAEYMTVMGNTQGTPLWARTISETETLLVFGLRNDGGNPGSLYTATVPTKKIYQHPSIIGQLSWTPVYDSQASDNSNFSYPTIANAGDDPANKILSWHDEDNANIWISSLPQRSHPKPPESTKYIRMPFATNKTFNRVSYDEIWDTAFFMELREVSEVRLIAQLSNDTSGKTTYARLAWGSGYGISGTEISHTGTGNSQLDSGWTKINQTGILTLVIQTRVTDDVDPASTGELDPRTLILIR